MPTPYHHVRFRWDKPIDLEKTATLLKASFKVKMLNRQRTGVETAFKEDWNVLNIKSDTLNAFLEPYRAVLFQSEAAPFTRHDLFLRETLLDLYDKLGPYRSHPIPEPNFDLERD